MQLTPMHNDRPVQESVSIFDTGSATYESGTSYDAAGWKRSFSR